ncbi:MAG TPA: PH domain-containing protein [Balneolaceae bacterium]|nr:PH domain-containing protein [Balneolaceae bacterium]
MVNVDQQEERFILRPSWKYFFFSYIFSSLAILLAGVGIVFLYYLRKKHKAIRYFITNSRITAIDEKYKHNVDLTDIGDIELKQTWLQKKLGIGTLLLHTSASNMEIAGIKNPEKYKRILEQAIRSQQKQESQHREVKSNEPSYHPGTMEKIDYLTGLWQQGLISDSEFKKERKRYE